VAQQFWALDGRGKENGGAEHFDQDETLFQSYVYTLKLILSLHYCKRRNKEFLGLYLDIKPRGEKLSRRDL
jgi:hypothetical protein